MQARTFASVAGFAIADARAARPGRTARELAGDGTQTNLVSHYGCAFVLRPSSAPFQAQHMLGPMPASGPPFSPQ
jgi:hypothetical protein